jgi:hypothetical protein
LVLYVYLPNEEDGGEESVLTVSIVLFLLLRILILDSTTLTLTTRETFEGIKEATGLKDLFTNLPIHSLVS